MAQAWYVAQTNPNAEAAAMRRLGRQQFETYCPKMMLRRPHRRGKVNVSALPLFAGYIFVHLDIEPDYHWEDRWSADQPDDRWKAVASTRGIVTLLPHSDRPIALPAGEIEGLREAEAAGNFIFPRGIAMIPGAKLRVEYGALAGAVVECIAADDRQGIVRALWDCFGRKTVVSARIDGVTVLRSG